MAGGLFIGSNCRYSVRIIFIKLDRYVTVYENCSQRCILVRQNLILCKCEHVLHPRTFFVNYGISRKIKRVRIHLYDWLCNIFFVPDISSIGVHPPNAKCSVWNFPISRASIHLGFLPQIQWVWVRCTFSVVYLFLILRTAFVLLLREDFRWYFLFIANSTISAIADGTVRSSISARSPERIRSVDVGGHCGISNPETYAIE